MKNRIKVIVIIVLMIIPIFLKAEEFSIEVGKANGYLSRDTFSSSYKRYLLYSNLRFGFENGQVVNNSLFTMGGFISEEEYKLTIPKKGSSYLFNGDTYWTLTKDGSKYKVIEYNGESNSSVRSYNVNTTSPRINSRATEYVGPNTSVSGTGRQNDPWIFEPMFKVSFIVAGGHATIEGSNENNGTSLSNVYLRAKCSGSECTKKIKLLIEDGFNLVSENCDGKYNEETKEYTVSNLTKDLECKLVIGTGKFEVELGKAEWDLTSIPRKVYLRQRDNYYKDKSYKNIIHKLEKNPSRYGYTFKGYYIKDTTIYIIDETGNFIDKVSIKKNKPEIVSDWQKNRYTITFNSNGGNMNVNETTKVVTFDEEYGVLPSATRAGYSFNGWYTEASNGTRIKETDIVKYAGNRTLYAQWTICSKGTFNTGNNTACTNCPTGYTSEKGSTLQTQCYMMVPPGKYLVAKNPSPTSCEKGTFRDGEAKVFYESGINCQTCSPGKTSDVGATACKDCSNKANVTEWVSGCTIKKCESAYAVYKNSCVVACSSIAYKDGSSCTKKCGTGTYNRVAYSSYDNRRCPSSDQSSGGSACNTQGCCSSTTPSYGNWGNWSGCSVSCGGGTQSRSRSYTNYSDYDRSDCGSGTETQTQNCNTQSCVKCYVYCSSPTKCKKEPIFGDYGAQMYGVFACDGSKTGSVLECWHYYKWVGYVDDPIYTKCDGGNKNVSPLFMCTTTSDDHYRLQEYCYKGGNPNGVKAINVSGSGYACSCN